MARPAARHTSEEFVEFLSQVVGLCRPKQKVHIIVDNLSAHKTKKVTEFLESHPESGLLEDGTSLQLEVLRRQKED